MDTLRGKCACGRNHYLIKLPQQDEISVQAQIVLDNSSHSRRLQASPLIAFLKVPVPWYQSSTLAFYPDETHQSIRRTFSSPDQDNLRNQFCGYCGTQLSRLDDSSPDSDGFIWLTLGSLVDDDLDKLEQLGLLDLEDTDDQCNRAVTIGDNENHSTTLFKSPQGALHRGAPWFEDSVENTKLGRLKRQRGGETSADGSTTLEWEVMEWTSNAGNSSPSKRKLDETSHAEDMQ